MGKLNTDQIFGDFTENCLGSINGTVLMFLKSYLIFRDILRYLGMFEICLKIIQILGCVY